MAVRSGGGVQVQVSLSGAAVRQALGGGEVRRHVHIEEHAGRIAKSATAAGSMAVHANVVEKPDDAAVARIETARDRCGAGRV